MVTGKEENLSEVETGKKQKKRKCTTEAASFDHGEVDHSRN